MLLWLLCTVVCCCVLLLCGCCVVVVWLLCVAIVVWLLCGCCDSVPGFARRKPSNSSSVISCHVTWEQERFHHDQQTTPALSPSTSTFPSKIVEYFQHVTSNMFYHTTRKKLGYCSIPTSQHTRHSQLPTTASAVARTATECLTPKGKGKGEGGQGFQCQKKPCAREAKEQRTPAATLPTKETTKEKEQPPAGTVDSADDGHSRAVTLGVQFKSTWSAMREHGRHWCGAGQGQ